LSEQRFTSQYSECSGNPVDLSVRRVRVLVLNADVSPDAAKIPTHAARKR